MVNELNDTTDVTIAVDDKSPEDVEGHLHPLVKHIEDKFYAARDARRTDEHNWMRAHYNFRGAYNPTITFTDTEKSRAFVKITKTKVMAAYGQILDVIFAEGKLPITVEPTEVPLGIEEEVAVDLNDPVEQGQLQEPEAPVIGFPGDGSPPAPGETLRDRVGTWFERNLPGLKTKEVTNAPTEVILRPAEKAAKLMNKKMHDQFTETALNNHIKQCVMEMAMLGSGVVKGPFAEDKEYAKWDEEGSYKPVTKTIPKAEAVSIWKIYPDPEAVTMDECDYLVHRHRITKSKLRALKKRPFFRHQAIDEAIDKGIIRDDEWWETQLDPKDIQVESIRYKVLEYWGNVDREFLKELQAEGNSFGIPDELEDQEEFQINAWLCNGELLRIVLNPFTPKRIPYIVVPYEANPYNMFGVGVAENMEDSQTLMNGFTRMAVDNAVLSGNLMIEVDEGNLVPGQDMRVFPGKVWRRQGGAPGQAIFGTKWPNTTNENMLMFDKFRELADQSTGIPSFSHGQTGVQGTGRTASGISMLLGAAALSTKTVIKNLDEILFRPLGESFFAFNMQFDFDKDAHGDLAVKASGTASLMSKEVKSQRLITFLQTVSSPMAAPFANFQYIIQEIAKALDLDSEKAVNDMKKAALQAKLLGSMKPSLPQDEQQGTGLTDPNQTGGGQIAGGGAPPAPGQQGFAGNTPPPQQGVAA